MSRFQRLVERLSKEDLEGILLLKDSNIRYISGFTGSDSYVVVSADTKAFITDARYTEQAEAECEGFRVIRWRSPALGLVETIAKVCREAGIKVLGFEKDKVTYELYEKLEKGLPGVRLVPVSGLVEGIRYKKDEHEIDCIRNAARISDEVFMEILDYIKPGVTEKDIEREMEYLIKKKGADGIGFPIIVAAGNRSSLPHAIPSGKRVETGDFVTLDFVVMYNGYKSDMTRTVVVGKASEKQKEIYGIVKAAQEEAEKSIKAGVTGNEPDNCARACIADAGYGDFFCHSLGHGVGLEVHEAPFMSTSCNEILDEGNVVTVEPGIYLPDWGGVRIEDTVLVKADGIEILTKSPKELMELL